MNSQELKDIRQFLKAEKHLNANWSHRYIADIFYRDLQAVQRWESGATEIPERCAGKIREIFTECLLLKTNRVFFEKVKQNVTAPSQVEAFLENLKNL